MSVSHVVGQNIFFDFPLQRTIQDKVHNGGFFCLVSILVTFLRMVPFLVIEMI